MMITMALLVALSNKGGADQEVTYPSANPATYPLCCCFFVVIVVDVVVFLQATCRGLTTGGLQLYRWLANLVTHLPIN